MPKQRLSLAWGPSFAELENGPEWSRVSAAQQTLPSLIKNQIQTETKAHVRVSLSLIRKILDTRLGNSVAQLVTEGFEHWVLLRQQAAPGRFDLAPSRRGPLSNPDNLFGITERISSSGEILVPLNLQQLEKISAELKKRGVERVCLNLLFTHRSSAHQTQAIQFLRNQGFQVFSRLRSPQSSDELSAWRRNLLDASLSSFFERLRQDLEDGVPAEFSYLDTERGFQPAGEVSTSALLFGREKALQSTKPLLYFGAEEWCWILPEDERSWMSPWGPLELTKPRCGFFSMQPGMELQLTPRGSIRWGSDLGMDPGPMLWGRSSKLTLMDLLGWELKTTPPVRRNEKSEAKVHEQIESLKKNSRDWRRFSDEQVQRAVRGQLVESFLAELGAAVTSDEFEVGGAFAAQILPALREAQPRWRWTERTTPARETATFWEKA